MDTGRKDFLIKLGAGLAMASLPGVTGSASPPSFSEDHELDTGGAPDDEKFWKQVARKYYNAPNDYINLENGYYGIQPVPVLAAFLKNINKANIEGAKFARKDFPALEAAIKKELAAFLQVSDEEIIITRNATEALNIAIQGYPFQQDDEVLLNQLDYFSMIEAFRMLEKRGKIRVNAFEMPLHPVNEDEIVEVYRKMITPKTKVLLLTHVSNINGLIIPVARIAAMAKEKGIDTITDSAHALGQIPFSLPALGSDFVGLNLHKWIGNPIGAGVLYIRKERIKEMQVLFGDVNVAETNITKLAHFGTTPFAVIMTIPDSLAFHKKIGVDRITRRLQYLKNTWVNALQSQTGVEIVTPAGKDLSCAIASFRVKGKTSKETVDYLYNQHKILTVGRTLGKDGCVRVTPAVYNSVEDVMKLTAAIKLMAG